MAPRRPIPRIFAENAPRVDDQSSSSSANWKADGGEAAQHLPRFGCS